MTSAAVLPDLESLDRDALKALIVTQHGQLLSQHEQLLSNKTEIESLQLLIAKLRRMQFGRKSEKLDRQIAQLELKLEELQAQQAEHGREAESPLPPAASADLHTSDRPARRPLPAHLPREVRTYVPKLEACPGLRWRTEASRRRCFGDAGNRTSAVQSDPPGSSQVGMCWL